ncbi:hypothetical protein HY745_10245 [Candidatus Desantisbacteria bacterium]|nr:hypothetical protein [Candidatus Desantisbacteria bacterium]MBI4846309.1 hypothetical protein [Candidatus Omnitrophota bacterium]
MKCYYHVEKDAIGICKNCNKGLCKECAVDVTNGLACNNSCEEEVKKINEIISRGKTAYRKTGKAYLHNAIIYGLLGLFFVLIGFYSLFTDGHSSSVLFILPAGIILLLGGFFSYTNSKKISKIEG